jgi:hypothetical protein
VETGRKRGTLRANTESDVQTARGLPGSQITDRLVQTCWADRGFPASCAKKGRRPDGGRYKSSLVDACLPGYPSTRGQLGRTQRKRGDTTRGMPAMASDPRARAAFKFLASFAARTCIGTRPHIQRQATRHRPPCLGIEDRMHPTERPTPGERSAGRTQHASHRILSQCCTGTPPLGAELRRDKRFCGEPWSNEGK